jgi:hypothetical protein
MIGYLVFDFHSVLFHSYLFYLNLNSTINPFNLFLHINVEHLSCLSQVIEIWIFNFPVKANKERLCKNLIPYNRKIKANQTLLIQELKNSEAKPPQLIPDIRKIEAGELCLFYTIERSKGIELCLFKNLIRSK